jgi:ABC-2 type transport system ATP-binding protein
MSEMAITADRLVVIGRGHLIADTTVADLAARFVGGVVARSARPTELAEALTRAGASVTLDEADRVLATGIEPAAVGRVALAAGVALSELGQVNVSLEDAYLDLTRESTDHRAGPTRRTDA